MAKTKFWTNSDNINFTDMQCYVQVTSQTDELKLEFYRRIWTKTEMKTLTIIYNMKIIIK